MSNLFGRTVKLMMEKIDIKESQLAEALNYDVSYISKWVNGIKLPSARNADKIISKMTEYFVDQMHLGDEQREKAKTSELINELRNAYDSDCSDLDFSAYNNNQMSFINDNQALIRLIRSAAMRAMAKAEGNVVIQATFDLIGLYGKEMKVLMQELHDMGVHKVELKFAIDADMAKNQYTKYVSDILSIIGELDYIEMSVVGAVPGQPEMLVINDIVCIQILWNSSGDLAAAFSTESTVIASYLRICEQINEASQKLLDPAAPENLKRTNVQLDSYSDHHQWLFFNEPPALLFPDELMDGFIAEADNEEYANYLKKLKSVFNRHTRKSNIKLVIYSSMLNKYLMDGHISLGNVSHVLDENQTKAHLQYLSNVMAENEDIELYLIRDTVKLSEELMKAPSIFLDTYLLNIENSKKQPNDNYHVSMDTRMRDMFQKYFEDMIEKPFCTKLTADDLLRYI